MATALFILFIFAIYHFVYESIIAPNVRLELRFELFKLRDELRNIKLNRELSKEDNEVFSILDETICVAINRLPFFNFSSNYDANKEFENNKSFKDRVLKKASLIDNTTIDDFKKINEKVMKTTFKAFLVNTGGFIFMIMPFLILLIILSIFSSSIKKLFNKIKLSVKNATLANENEFERCAHI